MCNDDYDDFYDALTGFEEHDVFERGAEDMERRAMRLEAEREADLEAAQDELAASECHCPDCRAAGRTIDHATEGSRELPSYDGGIE